MAQQRQLVQLRRRQQHLWYRAQGSRQCLNQQQPGCNSAGCIASYGQWVLMVAAEHSCAVAGEAGGEAGACGHKEGMLCCKDIGCRCGMT